MSIEPRYRIRTPWVANQVIDGEAVLIAFETGAYYSSERTGASVLSLLERQAPVSEIVARLSATHDASSETIEADVRAFIAHLSQEGLIVPCDATNDPKAGESDETPTTAAAHVWAPPLLTRYGDLEDLLILDPIHEVDESGWPVASTRAA
jgi:hypothetical protein